MDRHTDRWTDTLTYGQTHLQMDRRKMFRDTDRWTDQVTDGKTHLMDRQIYRWTYL